MSTAPVRSRFYQHRGHCRPANARSSRNLHNPRANHRILILPDLTTSSPSTRAECRETTSHHCRGAQVWPRTDAQVEGEHEWHLFDRQDLEPRRPDHRGILYRPDGNCAEPRMGRRYWVHRDYRQALLLERPIRQGEEVLHSKLDQDLREVYRRKDARVDGL